MTTANLHLAPGQCICRREGSKVYIEHADPIVSIDPKYIAAALMPETDDYLTLRFPDGTSLAAGGGILTIHGANRDVVYRLGPAIVWEGHRTYYVGKWPD